MKTRSYWQGAGAAAALALSTMAFGAGKQMEILPAQFQPNQGQAAQGIDYVAQGFGYSFGISATRAGLTLASQNGKLPTTVGVNFIGAAHAQATPSEKLNSRSSYIIGTRSIADVPAYARLRYADLWPGIDVIYYGNDRKLEYDFAVAPHADPSAIRLRFEGAKSVRLSASGDLLLQIGSEELVQKAPVAYQTIAGNRVAVQSGYVVAPNGEVRVSVAKYDRSQVLVIDPILVFTAGAFYAGNAINANAVTTDNLGLYTYVAGTTTVPGKSVTGLYVAKINNYGNTPSSNLFLYGAGDGNMTGNGVSIDSNGNLYIVGTTDSATALGVVNAFQPVSGGGKDGFLLKVPPSLNTLNYATYIGGTGDEIGLKVAASQAGVAYISGQTNSSNWPTPNSPTSPNGFAFAIDTTKSGSASKVYGIVLGGSGVDSANGVAVDANGNAYFGGSTNSSDFSPMAGTGYQTTKSGSNTDGFVVKLTSGGGVAWSTYYTNAPVSAIAQYNNQFAYVTGQSTGTINTTASAYQPSLGAGHVFVARFDTNLGGSGSLNYASSLGGSGQDFGLAITVPQGGPKFSGFAYVGGWTMSPNFPETGSPIIQSTFNSGKKNGFVAYFDPSQSGVPSLKYATYIGSNVDTMITGLAAPQSGEVSLSASAMDSSSNMVAGFGFKIGSQIWNNTFFATQQYLDLLDRQPDSGGLSFWVNGLNSGGETYSTMASHFFTSPEFTNGGLVLIKYYIAVLNRDPDFGGWNSYFMQYLGGRSLDSILAEFLRLPRIPEDLWNPEQLAIREPGVSERARPHARYQRLQLLHFGVEQQPTEPVAGDGAIHRQRRVQQYGTGPGVCQPALHGLPAAHRRPERAAVLYERSRQHQRRCASERDHELHHQPGIRAALHVTPCCKMGARPQTRAAPLTSPAPPVSARPNPPPVPQPPPHPSTHLKPPIAGCLRGRNGRRITPSPVQRSSEIEHILRWIVLRNQHLAASTALLGKLRRVRRKGRQMLVLGLPPRGRSPRKTRSIRASRRTSRCG